MLKESIRQESYSGLCMNLGTKEYLLHRIKKNIYRLVLRNGGEVDAVAGTVTKTGIMLLINT